MAFDTRLTLGHDIFFSAGFFICWVIGMDVKTRRDTEVVWT